MKYNDNVWRGLVNKHVISTWEPALKDSALTKSSLCFLNLQQTSLEEPHLVWHSALGNGQDLDKAIIKARFITGTYYLRGRRVHTETEVRTPSCNLCQALVENRTYANSLPAFNN